MILGVPRIVIEGGGGTKIPTKISWCFFLVVFSTQIPTKKLWQCFTKLDNYLRNHVPENPAKTTTVSDGAVVLVVTLQSPDPTKSSQVTLPN